MDSRPLRPRPSENSVPSLHSRHKSTGNLAGMASTSAAFGFQRPAKRSAFGDVTNMSRISAGGRDDSKVGLKSQPIAPLPGRANKENAALPKDGILRPIARPAGALKPRASNESRPADAAIRLVHQDQQHRISDSVALPLPLPSVPEQRASLSHARFDYLPLQPRHYKSQPQLRQPQPNLRKTQSRQFDRSDRLPLESIKLTETVPEVPESPELPEAREDTATALAPLEAVLSQEMQPQESGDTVYLDSLCYPVAESQPEVNHAVDYNQIAPELHQDAPTKASSVLHESSYPALSEPEEYWDEDDEDYDDQDQAYTTAHSFRSRDMTMGNVTTVLAPKQTTRVQRELEEARAVVEETMTPEEFEEEAWDVSMVAEYGEDIFEYLRELEIKMLPNPHYMETQTEVHWSMRSVLMDWLVQVHERFGLLPETLFLTVNYIDRFLSHKIVSMGKLQLVGATAILLASKYEEINCPSLDEIVYMVDKAYPAEEILKAERFMLSILNFELGWPGPMSFLRRVSKADDYDLDTRTLAKYFLELTIMDERFVATPPSFLAAGAHCLSRLILNKGDWTKHHVHYSGYTWSQLKSLVSMLIECCEHPKLHHIAVFEKYCSKKFKEAALIVQDALDAGFVLPQQSTPVRSSEPVVPSTMLDHSSYPAGVLTSY